MLISIEGGEGAGKSTLIRSLCRLYKESGINCLTTFEPGATALGSKLRSVVLNGKCKSPRSELFLFLADRAEHVDTVIKPALEKGSFVITDRFIHSTLCYQSHVTSRKALLDMSLFATGGLFPDCTLYLDVDPKLGFERIKKRESLDSIERKGNAFHSEVRDQFLRCRNMWPDSFFVIDASKSEQEVLQDARAIIDGKAC